MLPLQKMNCGTGGGLQEEQKIQNGEIIMILLNNFTQEEGQKANQKITDSSIADSFPSTQGWASGHFGVEECYPRPGSSNPNSFPEPAPIPEPIPTSTQEGQIEQGRKAMKISPRLHNR